MLRALKERRWKVNPKKLRVGYRQVKLLGHIVGHGQLKPDPKKLAAVKQLSPPTSVRQLRAFLGLVGYYRRMIPEFQKEGHALN